MEAEWAATWSVATDTVSGRQRVHWTDDAGRHEAAINPPASGLVACEARTVTGVRQDLLCGRATGHTGSHVDIGTWRRFGAVAD